MSETHSPEDRRVILANLFRAELLKLTPSMPGRLSGQQVAYAKGHARKAFLTMGF